jgi:hypothetical protein
MTQGRARGASALEGILLFSNKKSPGLAGASATMIVNLV